MNYWLLKSEPDVWSINHQKKSGTNGAVWDGVRNYQAAKNLSMKLLTCAFLPFKHWQRNCWGRKSN